MVRLYLVSHHNRETGLLLLLLGENYPLAAAKVETNAVDESGAACGCFVCPHQCERMCVFVCVWAILPTGLITGGNLTKPFAALPGHSR